MTVKRHGETYERIYAVVKRIPKGRVASYGQVAELAGFPGQARMVGYALNALTAGHRVPWQRVVNAQGAVSQPGAHGDYQRVLLEQEGIEFAENGRISLKRYCWRPRGSKD